MGSCTAGGAYVPAMSDEAVIVKGQGTIFLGGPPLVKAATGEIVTPEELGGAEVHTRQSGVADHYAVNDAHALSIARTIVGNLNRVKRVSTVLREPREPLYPVEELRGVIPADTRKPYDVRESHRALRRRAANWTNSSRTTAPRWSPVSPTSTAIRSASSPTTASCFRNRR